MKIYLHSPCWKQYYKTAILKKKYSKNYPIMSDMLEYQGHAPTPNPKTYLPFMMNKHGNPFFMEPHGSS